MNNPYDVTFYCDVKDDCWSVLVPLVLVALIRLSQTGPRSSPLCLFRLGPFFLLWMASRTFLGKSFGSFSRTLTLSQSIWWVFYTPCHLFINCRLGILLLWIYVQTLFFSIFCNSPQCKGSHSVNKRVHRLFLTVSIYQVYPSVTPRFVAAFYKVWWLLAQQLCWRLYAIATRILQ